MRSLDILKNYTYGITSIDKYLKYQQIPDEYLEKHPWMKSIIVFIFPFSTEKVKYERYLAPRFAYGEDYHGVVKEYLEKIAQDLKLDHYLTMTDVSFFDEKLLCYLAGLGSYGKNNLIINEKYGTNFAIGEIVTNIIFDYNELFLGDPCGDCTLCIKACPTNALDNNTYTRQKCISYITQYISEDYNLYDKVLRLAVGCDICQEVCQKNKKEYEFDPRFKINNKAYLNLNTLKTLDKLTYKEFYANKSFNWIGYLKMLRNILTLEVNNKNISVEEIEFFMNKHKQVKWFYNHLAYLKGKLTNGKN